MARSNPNADLKERLLPVISVIKRSMLRVGLYGLGVAGIGLCILTGGLLWPAEKSIEVLRAVLSLSGGTISASSSFLFKEYLSRRERIDGLMVYSNDLEKRPPLTKAKAEEEFMEILKKLLG